MSNEIIDVQGAGAVDGGPPLGAAAPVAPAGQQQGEQQQQHSQQTQQESKVVTVPTAAMKRIRDEERQKGKQEALAALAQQAGFESDVDLVSALAQLKQKPAQQAAPPAPAPTQQQAQPNQQAGGDGTLSQQELLQLRNDRREQGKFERAIEKLTRERDTFAQKYQQSAQELKTYREQLDAKDAEMQLRELAVSKGVKDVDYALRLYFREAEKGEPVDEGTFFESLRKEKPYLYGETVRPATTGTGAGTAPTAPKPGQTTQQAAGAGQFDARKASPTELKERLAKMGLNPHL